LTRRNGSEKRIAPGLELRLPQVRLGLRQFVLCLFRLGLAVGLSHNHLLLRLRQIGFRFLQLEFLLGGIELRHHVLLLHQLSRSTQRR